MSYKQNANANRDAIFGPPTANSGRSTSGASYKSNLNDNRAALFGNVTVASPAPGGGRPSSGLPSSSLAGQRTGAADPSPRPVNTGSNAAPPSSAPTSRPTFRSRTPVTTTLTGAAKVAKMKEAEEYRKKANDAMQKTLFSRPDPVVAGTYYRRAAEAYKLCGENRLERLHRIASGDMQMRQDSYASAATEYARAAELSALSDESTARKQKEVHQLYKNAAEAWTSMGEKGKAAECHMKAAFGLLIDKNETDIFDKPTHTALEEAVEFHVPDILNRMSSYRMTGGPSAGGRTDGNPKQMPSLEQQKEIAREEIANSAYAHENVQQMMCAFVKTGEYRSGLYAAGAVTALLEESGFATISLFKAFVAETILQLAMGDVVAADKTFMEVHLQNTSYLSSRECELAEDLIRSIKAFDHEALEQLKSSRALANVDPVIRDLVQTLQISGRARRKPIQKVAAVAATASATATTAMTEIGSAISSLTAKATSAISPASPREHHLDGEELEHSLNANYNEMDELMGEMGLVDSEDEEEADDDGIDLR